MARNDRADARVLAEHVDAEAAAVLGDVGEVDVVALARNWSWLTA